MQAYTTEEIKLLQSSINVHDLEEQMLQDLLRLSRRLSEMIIEAISLAKVYQGCTDTNLRAHHGKNISEVADEHNRLSEELRAKRQVYMAYAAQLHVVWSDGNEKPPGNKK